MNVEQIRAVIEGSARSYAPYEITKGEESQVVFLGISQSGLGRKDEMDYITGLPYTDESGTDIKVKGKIPILCDNIEVRLLTVPLDLPDIADVVAIQIAIHHGMSRVGYASIETIEQVIARTAISVKMRRKKKGPPTQYHILGRADVLVYASQE